MKNTIAWILATFMVVILVVIVIGGAMLLVHWGNTTAGIIWLVGGALIIRYLGKGR